ncbi:MAG TPA: sulfur oxidation c-type cytochrome SoxX [Xanthobacteraceae bacterium]|jgi:sulfur-oxidizing protein SoxX
MRPITSASAFLLATIVVATAAFASPSAGEQLAFDRSKGNCLTCHDIKGGDSPGNLGPPLNGMKTRFPNRADLVAIISDETKRNPQTVMPPFRRNLILTDPEINAIIDFLYTR